MDMLDYSNCSDSNTPNGLWNSSPNDAIASQYKMHMNQSRTQVYGKRFQPMDEVTVPIRKPT
jgi:hypothetical protein